MANGDKSNNTSIWRNILLKERMDIFSLHPYSTFTRIKNNVRFVSDFIFYSWMEGKILVLVINGN
jgi:hypothetical protein